MLFNLLIGVILEEFARNQEENETHELLESVYEWRDEWKKYDPEATGRITAEEFVKTIRNSPLPAGIKERASEEKSSTHISTASHLWDLHLLASQQRPEDQTTKLYNILSTCFGLFSGGLQEESRASVRENTSPIDGVPWMVEYEAAVLAVAAKVLYAEGKLKTPIYVEPLPNELFIVEWFCQMHIKKPELLQIIRQVKTEYESYE